MAEWNYKITITNQLDRELKLVADSAPWGKTRSMPNSIMPGESKTYNVYSPAGAPYGLEFYMTFKDVPPKGSVSYGTIDIGVDMSYWKHNNTSFCNTQGILQVEGFAKVPNGNHDFQTSIAVSTSL